MVRKGMSRIAVALMLVVLRGGSRALLRSGGLSLSTGRATFASSGVRMMERISSEGVSLDTTLVSTNPALVLSHLKARRSDESIVAHVSTIGSLRTERNALIVEGDAAKNTRKSLSLLIGQSMKDGKEEQVQALKLQVEQASAASAAADEKLAKIDADINAIFSIMPNLLDDR